MTKRSSSPIIKDAFRFSRELCDSFVKTFFAMLNVWQEIKEEFERGTNETCNNQLRLRT